ncbi:unnamed protein product, partial [Ectocarpus fasciculatus]
IGGGEGQKESDRGAQSATLAPNMKTAERNGILANVSEVPAHKERKVQEENRFRHLFPFSGAGGSDLNHSSATCSTSSTPAAAPRPTAPAATTRVRLGESSRCF